MGGALTCHVWTPTSYYIVIVQRGSERIQTGRMRGYWETERRRRGKHRGKRLKIRIQTRPLINFAASVYSFPKKIRNKRRSSAKWFLLFCLSQFVVHLFTFLLVPHRWSVLGLVLRGRLLGAPQWCALLIFGFLHWLALAWCCGSRLFGFRARGTIPVNLRMSDSGNEIPELS